MCEENEAAGKGGPKSLRGKRAEGAHRVFGARLSMKNNADHHGHSSHTVTGSMYKYIRKGVAADAGVHGGKVPARFRKTEGERPGFLPTAPAGRRERGAELKGAHSVRDLRAWGRRAPPRRKAKKGEQAQDKNAPPDRASTRCPEGGAKVLFHGMGIARAKAHIGLMNTTYSISRFCR